jgi:hypothetical protein
VLILQEPHNVIARLNECLDHVSNLRVSRVGWGAKWAVRRPSPTHRGG